jgi:restriction system protein
MECLGPQCAAMLLDWLKRQGAELGSSPATPPSASPPLERQGLLWKAVAYQEDAPAIRTAAEWAGAVEHLEYAIFRRYQNQLTRAERTRMDNTIENVLFKMDRYLARLDDPDRAALEAEIRVARDSVRDGRERVERLRHQARRADAKLAQLATLTPEGFEEFVGELFEALGYEVEVVGGAGDEGTDLRVRRQGLLGIVQCKYQSKGKGVVGSPELQKFLGTIHHTRSHKGYFVTTRTFTLAAEKFVADHPIELIDGPRLVELVREAVGPGAKNEQEPGWF